MAPSPTGEYHIGHIRTVLYDIAFAKKHHGKFIIRIEDTDRGRLVEGAIDRILDVIADYGFSWDEGPRVGGDFGPYIQSERLPLYKKYALELIEKKAAYYCFCTAQRLTQMREEQKAQKIASTKYDKHCFFLPEEEVKKKLAEREPHVIRLNVPANKMISFNDVVFGTITVNSNEIDDQILIKSDGFPTYHMGVVVDDHLMKITHIMRGNDWIPSTPKHILIYEAFGWELPVYIHLPNLKELGSNQKLSKRYGPVSAREFLDAGYLPKALINFLMLLGWNPGTEQEIYSFDEFVKAFELTKIHKTDLVAFDRQKLTWMNGVYIREMPVAELVKTLVAYYAKSGEDKELEKIDEEMLLKIVQLAQSRINTLKEFFPLIQHFLPDSEFVVANDTDKAVAHSLAKEFQKIGDWNKETILDALKIVLKEHSIRMPILYTIITGQERGLPLPESLEILGKEVTLSRLDKAFV